MSDEGFVVAEFYDGVQVIPKSWLQSDGLCKYPSHYNKDSKIRKAIKKEETPGSDWPTCKITRIFAEYPSLEKADAKAKLALYTSDMDTEKETNKSGRKFNAQKVFSSESEESCTDINLAPPAIPPAKRQRKNTSQPYNEIQSSSVKSFTEKYKISSQNSNLSSHSSFVQDTNDCGWYEREENDEYISNEESERERKTHNKRGEFYGVNKMGEVGQTSCMRGNRETREENNNLNRRSQTAIEDHLKRLTREIVTIKYDMRQVLNFLDILVEKSNKSTGTQECGNTKLSFEEAENRFPLQTVAQLAEVEDILKAKDSQHNAEIRAYIKSIGGTNIDDTVKRTLYKTFSNKLAENYNWEGRRGKEPLHKLELMKIIFRSVLHNIPNSDQGKIQRRVMEWFRHSKARRENEEKRMQRNEDNARSQNINLEAD